MALASASSTWARLPKTDSARVRVARAALGALAGEGDLRRYQDELEDEIQPELDAARAIAYMFYGMLKRARRPWMLASEYTPFLWGSLFAVQRGESSYAREAKRAGPLTAVATAMLRRRDRQGLR